MIMRLTLLLALAAPGVYSQDWPQENVVWKTAVPPGNSSPAVEGDRIILTAVESEKLFTVAQFPDCRTAPALSPAG